MIPSSQYHNDIFSPGSGGEKLGRRNIEVPAAFTFSGGYAETQV
jgi:hypothetical protein